MKTLVADASVVAKWFPPFDTEFLAVEARQILEQWSAGKLTLVTPDLLQVEVANALCSCVRRSRCTASEASKSLELLRECALPVISAERLTSVALSLAIQHNRSVYDCVYVALAMEMKTEAITADERLANAVGGVLPVKWLGSWFL